MSRPNRHRPKPDRYLLDIQSNDTLQESLKDLDEWLHTPNPNYDIDPDAPEVQELVTALDKYDDLLLPL